MTKKYLAISTFLFLLLALSYGISRRIKLTSPQPQPPTPSEQNQQSSPSGKTPEPQIAVPEGWKIFENTKLGYKVAYPANWFVQYNNSWLSIATVKDIGPILSGMDVGDAIINIMTFPIPEEKMQKAGDERAFLTERSADYHIRADYVKQTKFGDYVAVERMGKPISDTEPGYTLLVEFIRDNNLYCLSLLSLTKGGLFIHDPIFRKMLETLTFF